MRKRRREMQSLLWPEQNLFSWLGCMADILFFDHPLLGRVSRPGHRTHKQRRGLLPPHREKLAALEFPALKRRILWILCHLR